MPDALVSAGLFRVTNKGSLNARYFYLGFV